MIDEMPYKLKIELARYFVRAANKALEQQLSRGQQRDLLKDNTNWHSEDILAIVQEISDQHLSVFEREDLLIDNLHACWAALRALTEYTQNQWVPHAILKDAYVLLKNHLQKRWMP